MNLRLVHVASFQGNAGDQANHAGLYGILGELTGRVVCVTEVEIRRAYRNYSGPDPLRFDQSFVELCNSHDAVVFGGGNFFEVWLPDSSTGCTIDISSGVLDRIAVPTLFFGLGFDMSKGAPPESLSRFRAFLEDLLLRDRVTVTVRNDGSHVQLREAYGPDVAQQVPTVPDGGFFAPLPDSIDQDPHRIAISITPDMPEIRFPALTKREAYDRLVATIAEYITRMVSTGEQRRVVLVPHVYTDVRLMGDVLDALPDTARRTVVSVAGYYSQAAAHQRAFSPYAGAGLAVSMRFHGTVVPFAWGTPTIGLATYRKVSDLLDELESPEQRINLRDTGVVDTLVERSETALTNRSHWVDHQAVVLEKLRGAIGAGLDPFVRALEGG